MLVKHLVPLYMREGKSYLTIAIGCTGGRHRSVYIAHTIAEALRSMNLSVDEYHRDMTVAYLSIPWIGLAMLMVNLYSRARAK